MPADTECSICYCPYARGTRSPRILPCGHIFCSQCLLTLLSSAEPRSPGVYELPCPLCRQPAQASPADGELPFPVDPALDRLALTEPGSEPITERGPRRWVRSLKRRLGLGSLRHPSSDAVCVDMRDMVLMASFQLI
ncbi:RING finger protein 225-like [Hemiscyllium ocellatum]|uniref:RING finger protein 225-like n=1 Tax=Hemiscyllium ocellatum TaxID=170820 RepID=UPI0029668593|nr:RING finger protein 225-like [Hemiscyllium ocellatum]